MTAPHSYYVVSVTPQLIIQVVPRYGTIVALLLGVRRVYVVICPFVNFVGAFLLSMALRLHRNYG